VKYLLLIYGNESAWAARSQDEKMTAVKGYMAVGESLQANGQMVVAERLQPTSTATTVRIRDGKTLTTDGPFAETKEQLAGFYCIDVKNLDEAIEVAKQMPGAHTGSVEVRPIHAM
jgi:hypothetical protein